MKKRPVLFGTTTLVAGIVFTLTVPTVYASDNVADTSIEKIADEEDNKVIFTGQEGPENDSVIYKLTNDGTLHVYSGTVGADGYAFASGMDNEYQSLVTKISFDGDVKALESTSNFFSNFKNLKEIANLKNFDTSSTSNMSNMFSGLTKLQTLDFSGFKTSNVTSMSSMFANLSQLKSMDLSGFNTSKVVTMSNMFSGSGLESLDVSKLNVSNVKYMTMMFSDMPNLNTINVSGWKFNDSVNMMQLFSGADKLTTVDLSTWNTKNISTLGYLMGSSINKITVSKDTSLLNSFLGVDITTGEYVFSGYWVNIDDLSKLITASDFGLGVGEYDGTYFHVPQPDTVTSDVTFKSNKGEQTSESQSIVIDDLSDINDEFDIEVPALDGHKADKKTVKGKLVVKIDENGQAKFDIVVVDPDDAGYITYTADETTTPDKPGNGNSGSSSSKPNIKNVKRLVTTHPYSDSVSLYKLNGDSISNRALAHNSEWFSDQEVTVKGVKYYRVATDEWIKASDAYVYESQDLVITTGPEIQYLTTSRGKTVSNRALAGDTSWKVDRLIYIDGVEYYRVATNEFVPVNSVKIK